MRRRIARERVPTTGGAAPIARQHKEKSLSVAGAFAYEVGKGWSLRLRKGTSMWPKVLILGLGAINLASGSSLNVSVEGKILGIEDLWNRLAAFSIFTLG